MYDILNGKKEGFVNHFVYDLLIMHVERKIFDANFHLPSYSCHIYHQSTCNVKKCIPLCVYRLLECVCHFTEHLSK